MHKTLFKSLSTPTAKNTMVFYIASFTQNIFRYFFHLILLRFLVPAEYGEFLSYLSLTYILSIPMGTVATVVTKFVSDFKAKDDSVSTNLFFYYLLKTLSPITVTLGMTLILFANPLSVIFKAHPIAFVVLGLSMFVSLFQSIITSYITAFQKFIFVSLVGFVTIILSIVLSILFIRLGLGATGAVLGQLVASIIGTLIIFWQIRPSVFPRLTVKKPPRFSLGGFTGYSFIYSLGTLSLISTDILVVRAFSDSHFSGLYSALSILGRMILFGLTPLIGLTLPIATHRHAATGSAKSVLVKLGALILALGVVGAGIFSLFPAFIVRILSGTQYLAITSYLWLFAFSMVFFALSQFVLSFLMATGRPQANFLLLAGTLLQPVLFYAYHLSFSGLIWSNFTVHLLLVLSLLMFLLFPRTNKM